MIYRPDIDGLRAIAVLTVVLYHFGVSLFDGGFVGVDIFFVISGYLITGIIYDQLQQKRFTLRNFYARRFKRILPPLIVVVLFTLIAGYFFLLPGEYADLSTSSVYAVFGFSNYFFMWNTGYFDNAAELKPLLHAWSLAVEEQYYLFWPIVMILLVKYFGTSKKSFIVFLLGIIVVSFTLSALIVNYDQQQAFYMIYTRAWELALGALLVFIRPIKRKVMAEGASLIGLMSIIYPVLFYNEDTLFPGFAALLPCLGAALLIWPKESTTSVGRSLALEPFRQIGLISYSLYLWHWPLLVIFRQYALIELPVDHEVFMLVVLSFAAAYLSYRFVEQPFRKNRQPEDKTIKWGAVAIMSTALVSLPIILSDGYPNRLPKELSSLGDIDSMWKWDCPRTIQLKGLNNPVCSFGADWHKSEKKIVLWGDSYAEHLAPILQSAIKDKNISAILYRHCPAPFGKTVKYHRPTRPQYEVRCQKSRAAMTAFLKVHNSVQYVISSASLSNKLDRLYLTNPDDRSKELGISRLQSAISELYADIKSPTRKLVLFSEFPSWSGTNSDPIQCLVANSNALLRAKCEKPTQISLIKYKEHQGPYEGVLQNAARNEVNILALTPATPMCETGLCINILNDEYIYRDTGHLRRDLKAETLSVLAEISGLKNLLADP